MKNVASIVQNASKYALTKGTDSAKKIASEIAAETADKLKAEANTLVTEGIAETKSAVRKGIVTKDADAKGTDAKDAAKDAKDADAKDAAKDAKDADAKGTDTSKDAKDAKGTDAKGGPGDVANTSTPTPTPTPTPTQSVSGSASAPPSVGTDSDTIKVEFQALYDNAYTEIKQCFCQGMANLFNDAFIPSTEHVYEALNKALYVDVVDKNSGGIASQINPDYEMLVGDQIEKIMKFIMTNPDPQIKIDIRKNLSGGCNISQEHHQASITRGKPTAIVGGSTYKHLAKNKKTYTQKKPHKKSM